MLVPALAVTSCSEDDDNNDEQVAAIALLAAAQAANAVPENFVNACLVTATTGDRICYNAWNTATAFEVGVGQCLNVAGNTSELLDRPCTGDNALGECKLSGFNQSQVYYAGGTINAVQAETACTAASGTWSTTVTGVF